MDRHTTACGQAVCGDVNKDSNVDIMDALLLAQCSVGLTDCPDISISNVNCDDNVNIVDALIIAQFYVDLITTLDCCDPPTIIPIKIYKDILNLF